MKKDYRNTEYCSYNNIAEMKESLKNEILNMVDESYGKNSDYSDC